MLGRESCSRVALGKHTHRRKKRGARLSRLPQPRSTGLGPRAGSRKQRRLLPSFASRQSRVQPSLGVHLQVAGVEVGPL
jgi:hypothetical protein